MFQRILAGRFEPLPWLSAPCTHLLQRMLMVQPGQRLTMEGLLQHPWFVEGEPGPPPVGQQAHSHIRCFLLQRVDVDGVLQLRSVLQPPWSTRTAIRNPAACAACRTALVPGSAQLQAGCAAAGAVASTRCRLPGWLHAIPAECPSVQREGGGGGRGVVQGACLARLALQGCRSSMPWVPIFTPWPLKPPCPHAGLQEGSLDMNANLALSDGMLTSFAAQSEADILRLVHAAMAGKAVPPPRRSRGKPHAKGPPKFR